MNLTVKDLESFKLVMTTITNILRMSVAAELQYHTFKETFYTLHAYDLPVLIKHINFMNQNTSTFRKQLSVGGSS